MIIALAFWIALGLIYFIQGLISRYRDSIETTLEEILLALICCVFFGPLTFFAGSDSIIVIKGEKNE